MCSTGLIEEEVAGATGGWGRDSDGGCYSGERNNRMGQLGCAYYAFVTFSSARSYLCLW
jgi:hypothetical protein